MQSLFQDLSKNQKISTKKFHEIIVKTFFTNKTNENYLNPTLTPKFIFMPVIKQTTSTLESQIIGGVGIIGGLDIVIISNRGVGIIGGWTL